MKTWHIERIGDSYRDIETGEFKIDHYYVPLRMTGKWKLQTNMVTQELDLFIQHRTWCGIPWWIREYDLVEREAKLVAVYDCG